MTKKIVALVVLLFICSGVGFWLDYEDGTTTTLSGRVEQALLTTAEEVDTVINNDRAKPAPGYVILSNGDEYNHKSPEGYIGTFPSNSYEDAVKWTWSMYDFKNKPEPVWTEVTQ